MSEKSPIRLRFAIHIAIALLLLASVLIFVQYGRSSTWWFLSSPLSPINRTEDKSLVSFKYTGRGGVQIYLQIPKSFLWSTADQQANGESELTSIEVIALQKADASISLSPYTRETASLFERESDALVEVLIRSHPAWLPTNSNASETNRLNSEAFLRAERLDRRMVRTDGRVSELRGVESIVDPIPDTELKWYLVEDHLGETWIAKCTLHRLVVVDPQWRCSAQYINGSGLTIATRFPLRFIAAAPELRESIDQLVLGFMREGGS